MSKIILKFKSRRKLLKRQFTEIYVIAFDSMWSFDLAWGRRY